MLPSSRAGRRITEGAPYDVFSEDSIVSDCDFLPPVTRPIHVDIRYVLGLMQRLEGADRLLAERGTGGEAVEKSSVP